MSKKHKSDPITSKDLMEYLNTQDDFSLELYVYSKAKELGFSATHGGTYIDPITSKPRQYDVRACKTLNNMRIDLAIECKSLKKSYPLLVSCIPRDSTESLHQVVFSYKGSKSSFAVNPLEPSAKVLTICDNNQFYPIAYPVGKSTVQVGKTSSSEFVVGDADVYDKWTQALGSASELIQATVDYYKDTPENKMFAVVLPILVVADDTLWISDYSENGFVKEEPKKVNSIELYVDRNYWKSYGISYTVSHLHFFTKTGITEFLTKISAGPDIFDAIFPMEDINKIRLRRNSD